MDELEKLRNFKERFVIAQKKYFASEKGKLAAKKASQKQYINHHDEICLNRKEYYSKNKEVIKQKFKDYYQKNKEHIKEKMRLYRANKKNINL